MFFFFFKQKTAYEIVSRDWSSDVCSSDLGPDFVADGQQHLLRRQLPHHLADIDVWLQRHHRHHLHRHLSNIRFRCLGFGSGSGIFNRRFLCLRRLLRHLQHHQRPLQIGRASCRKRV